MNRRRHPNLLEIVLVLLIALSGGVLSADSKDKTPPKDKSDSPAAGLSCVRWTHEARYQGFGYNHFVYLKNTCKLRAICEVKTDVNPERIKATLAPKQKKTVITFRGSPARVFSADVSCRAK